MANVLTIIVSLFGALVICKMKSSFSELIKPEDLQVVHVMHRNSGAVENNERIDVFFIAEKWSGEILNKEPHKCDDLSWFDLDTMPKNTIPYIKQAIDKIKNKINYSEHGW